MKKRTILKISMLILVLSGLLFSFPLSAMNGIGNERLKGTVVDRDGNPIANATVVIQYKGHFRSKRGGESEFIPTDAIVRHEKKTNAKGDWHIIGISSGTWEVTASYDDLAPMSRRVNIILATPAKPLHFKLEPPQISISANNVSEDLKDGQIPKKGKSAKELYDLGLRLMDADYTKKAIICFRLATEKEPKWSPPYLKLGYAYFNYGDMKRALQFFETFLELEPNSEDAAVVTDIVESLKEM